MWNNHNMRLTDCGGLKAGVLVLLLTACIASSCLAEPVDTTTAQAAAASLLMSEERSSHSMSAEMQTISEPRPVLDPETGEILAYVVDLAPKGYVIVGPDTRLTPIIAYSLQGTFVWDEGPSNTLLHILRADLSARLKALSDGAISRVSEEAAQNDWNALQQRTSSVSPSTDRVEIIGPLIEATTWAQNSPWSDFVPVDPNSGERSLTGCVATALAQIVTYWRYPEQIVFTEGSDYVTATRRVSVSAASASITQIEYPTRSFYNPSDTLMAELSHAAGVSVQMDYTSDGSGAFVQDMAYALAGGLVPMQRRHVAPAVWEYASADVRTYVKYEWGEPFVESQAAFYLELQDGLEEGEPAVLNIVTTSTAIGHAVICDGYDAATGRYHLNLGWGGQSDGWYDLPDDIPTGYNVVESGIFNIRPPKKTAEATHTSNPEGDSHSAAANGGSVQVSPIPLQTETTFEYGGETPTIFTVQIFGADGHRVWSHTASDQSEISWDGRDLAGTRMPNGPYIFVVSGIAGTQPFKQQGILFIHR
ncbi:C10 family peptidase [Candidatus Bipolaricaulota bacterium]